MFCGLVYEQISRETFGVPESTSLESISPESTRANRDSAQQPPMRTVRDEEGATLLLVKESSDSCLVRDPRTGEEYYRDADDLEAVSGESPLATAAKAVPEPVRRVLSATPDERALGLLVDIHERGPHSVRYLLDATDLCESDLFGLLTEFRAAGLVEEADVVGERGYDTTEMADEGLAALRD